MTPIKLNLLIIDDNDDDIYFIKEYLSAIDTYNITADYESNYKAARKRILHNEHDVYIVDYLLGPATGLELVNESAKAGITKPFILLTGKGDKEVDIAAAKAGVYDYLTKSELTSELLERSLRYSLHRYSALVAVEKSEKRYKEIFSKSTDIILILDRNFQFVTFNPALMQLLGYEFEDLMGKTFAALFEDQKQASWFLHSIEFSEAEPDIEIGLLSITGARKVFLASVSRIASTDGALQYQVILHDYTNLKRSVSEKMLNARIEASGKLVRSLAHEIRNPLTNINLATYQLKADLPSDKDIYVDIIERNSARINNLIGKLMNLSNPTETTYERIDVKQLLQLSLANAKDRIKLKNIEVTEVYAVDDTFITGDAGKMLIATSNIIINAIEAMEEKMGKLFVSTQVEDEMVIIQIQDNGAGIPAESLPHLFQPFYTGKKNGMGIGLAIVHSVVKSHNGTIGVDSEQGRGTTFTIKLKREVAAAGQPA